MFPFALSFSDMKNGDDRDAVRSGAGGSGSESGAPVRPGAGNGREESVDTLRQELVLKTRQLQAVGEISAALASTWDLEATLEVITRVTSEVMGVASCSIYLLQERRGGSRRDEPGTGTGPVQDGVSREGGHAQRREGCDAQRPEEGSRRLVLKATTGLAKAAIGVAGLDSGEGLTGWTVTHGLPVAVTDVLLDPRFKLLPETDEEGLRSLLAVPLALQGRVIGAMNVQTAQPHEFSTEEVELLSMIGNLAAGALEKAMLYDRMRRQIRELEGLVEVSRTIVSPLYLDDMLGVVAQMAARVMAVRSVVLHLLDEATGCLTLRAGHNTAAAARERQSFDIGEGLVGEVAREARPVAVADVRQDPRYVNRRLAEAEGLVSFLGVPLVVRQRIVGVLSCYTESPHDFAPTEIDLFSTLANQTALAIENARLVISTAVVREMHHRVKNNLQSVAMLLRLQMGSSKDEGTRGILAGAMARILTIAAVHETMSEQGLSLVDVRQVLERVAASATQLVAGKEVCIEVVGEPLALPSRMATSLALAVGEFVQNAVKHAFPGRETGRIRILVQPGASTHEVHVVDDGVGSAGTRSERKGLGIELVQTLVSHDLKGQFELTSAPEGTRAVVRFPAPVGPGTAGR